MTRPGEEHTEGTELGVLTPVSAGDPGSKVDQCQQADCIWLCKAGEGLRFYSKQMRRFQRVLNRQLMGSNYFSN
jgi:hypothetical protein